MINKELMLNTLAAIKANPQHWDQTSWHCGTTHCFAGFAELLSRNLSLDTYIDGYEINDWEVNDYAIAKLGLTDDQAVQLFDADNTLEDLERIVGVLVTA